jgi:hypothetical protein
MNADKLLSDFLAAQKTYPTVPLPVAPPKKRTKTNKNLINPGHAGEVEEGFEYIITKKPKAKKVVKYLQDMANCIMAEADS